MPPRLRGLGWTGHPMHILPTPHEFKSRDYFTGLAHSLIRTCNAPVCDHLNMGHRLFSTGRDTINPLCFYRGTKGLEPIFHHR